MPLTGPAAHAAAAVLARQPHWWQALSSWGSLGSAVSGLAAAALAVAAIIGGSAGLGDWRDKVRAQRDLAREKAENIRLDRHRVLEGWSPHGVEVYGVRLVTQPGEIDPAVAALASGGYSDYVILRVSEGGGNNGSRAHDLRQLIERDGIIARAPQAGEYEALREGRKILLERDGAAA